MAGHPLLLAAGSLLDADPSQLLAAAAATGFTGVGVRLGAEALAGADATERLQGWATQAGQLGVAIHDVEVHRLSPSAPDPGPLVDAAAALGAEAVLVVSDDPDVAATEAALAAFVERCRRAGVIAALEYMAWTTPSTPTLAVELAQRTGAVVVVDLLHHHRVGAGPDELGAIADAGVLGWVQLADAPAEAPDDLVHEARHARLPPGDGAVPLAALLRAVPADVAISVEVQSDDLARRLPPVQRAALLSRRAVALLDGS